MPSNDPSEVIREFVRVVNHYLRDADRYARRARRMKVGAYRGGGRHGRVGVLHVDVAALNAAKGIARVVPGRRSDNRERQ